MSFIHDGSVFFKCFVRKEYLYNLESHHGETIEAYVVGITCMFNRPIGFDCLLNNGALIARLPISAICHEEDAEDMGQAFDALGILEMWECMSDTFTIVELKRLKGMDVEVFLADKNKYEGEYMFTISYANSDNSYGSFAEEPSEVKNHHIIKLDNGNFCALPNNRICWKDASFITPFTERPDYKVNKQKWYSEDGKKFKIKVEKEDVLFYDIESEGKEK